MPIKSFTFAFKLDAKELLAYVVERNIAVDIHATGSHRAIQQAQQEVLPPPIPVPVLPAPSKKHTARELVIAFFMAHPNETISTVMVSELLAQAGFSPNTQHGLIYGLRAHGFIRRVGYGSYQAAKKILREVE